MITHIRIGDVSPRVQYTADGVQTDFTYPFPIFEATDLEAYLDQTRQESGYTVVDAGSSDGGTVTFDAAPAEGTEVTLRRRIAIQRTSDFQESGAFRAKVINDQLDYLTAALQQVADDQGRSVQLSPTAGDADLTLPDTAARAGKALIFDDNGDVAVGSDAYEDQAANAAASADAAATSETNAAASAAAAQTARTGAETARDEAETARDEAQAAVSGVLVSADDTTAGPLEDKLLASGLAGLSTQTPGGDETRTLDVPKASQIEAEAGTDDSKAMTPLRTADAIAALAGGADARDQRLSFLYLAELRNELTNMINSIVDPFADTNSLSTLDGLTHDAGGDYIHNPGDTTTTSASGEWSGDTGSYSFSSADIASTAAGSSIYVTTAQPASTQVDFDFVWTAGTDSYIGFADTSATSPWSGGGSPTAGTANEGCLVGWNGSTLYMWDWANTSDTTYAAADRSSGTSPIGQTCKLRRTASGAVEFYIGGALEFTSADTNTAQVHPFVIDTNTANLDIDTVSWTVPGTPATGTPESVSFTADSAPSTARLALQLEPVDSLAVNTDFIAEVGRDGGASWKPADLTLAETLADGTELWEDDSIDLSGQPSGTDLRYRLKFLNNKEARAHGVVLQWRI